MSWSIKIARQPQARGRSIPRPLALESLECRTMLAGDVTVTLAANVLTLTGDASGNRVEIRPGDAVGEYRIVGIDTGINGPTLINDPFNTIRVDLRGGSDHFTIVSEVSGTANKVVVTGDLLIENSDGDNVNRLLNARVNGALTVNKVAGTSESTLELVDTVVVGDATLSAGARDGDSKTFIQRSEIQGNLEITNNFGKDIFVLDAQSEIGGNLDIDNGDGDTRTVLGNTEDPTVWGDLEITNGAGNDTLIINETEVWGRVAVDNGEGHTSTTVQTSEVGKGVAVGSGGDFSVTNDAGIDSLVWRDSEVRDDLLIDNHGNGLGAAPPGMDAYGSTTELRDARIGNDLRLDGDNGFDVVNLFNAQIVDDVLINLNDGASSVALSAETVIGENFDLNTGAGDDTLRFDNATVEGDVDVALFAGRDIVEVVNGSRLLGSTRLRGGAGIDRLVRQVGPDTEAVEIAFLDEDLEEDVFIFE